MEKARHGPEWHNDKESNPKIHDLLARWAGSRGYRLGMSDVGMVDMVRRELASRRDSGEIPASFFKDQLTGFTYQEGCALENPRSVVIVAVPRPAHILEFSFGGKTIETVLPPTYVQYRATFTMTCEDLRNGLMGTGHKVEILNAPLKALAERLGVITYGRNNIGYIEGLGSWFQLVGLVSDISAPPRAGSRPPAKALLPQCRKCIACIAECPRGAIGRGRFLLRAGECYTVFSESIRPIPEHVRPPSPNCLVGCLKCQEICPANKDRMVYEKTAVSFNAEETEAFLGRAGSSPLAREAAQAQFKSLGLSEDMRIFARNLARILGLNS